MPALKDIDIAIEKSEDNVPKYFFFWGHLLEISGRYKEAISDFTICISLDA